MKIETRKFGEIEIDDSKTLVMPEGLPGFQGFTKFVLLEDSKTAPFCWFQSIEEPNLALAVINPFLFKPDYAMDLDGFIEERGWTAEKTDLLIYVVVNVSKEESPSRITANLIGPIVINLKNNEAVQAVLSTAGYSHQHNILEAT